MSKTEYHFTGFSDMTIDFLKNLRNNNDKAWFTKNKNSYQEYLVKPFQNLVMDLAGDMLAIDPGIEVAPKIDKTLSRIFRDTRFSKDKSPYKTVMWMTFKRPSAEWRDEPAFFFELSIDSYRYGMGFFSASKKTMDKLKALLDNEKKVFLKLFSAFSKNKEFVVEGEKYKRPVPIDEDTPKIIQDWYQRKNVYFVCNKKIDNLLFKKELTQELRDSFKMLTPFYHYFWKTKI